MNVQIKEKGRERGKCRTRKRCKNTSCCKANVTNIEPPEIIEIVSLHRHDVQENPDAALERPKSPKAGSVRPPLFPFPLEYFMDTPPKEVTCQQKNHEQKCFVSSERLSADPEYIQFALRITEDIIRNTIRKKREIRQVIRSHMEANRGRLDKDKMLKQVESLMNDLNIDFNHDDRCVTNVEGHCNKCPQSTESSLTLAESSCSGVTEGDLNEGYEKNMSNDKNCKKKPIDLSIVGSLNTNIWKSESDYNIPPTASSEPLAMFHPPLAEKLKTLHSVVNHGLNMSTDKELQRIISHQNEAPKVSISNFVECTRIDADELNASNHCSTLSISNETVPSKNSTVLNMNTSGSDHLYNTSALNMQESDSNAELLLGLDCACERLYDSVHEIDGGLKTSLSFAENVPWSNKRLSKLNNISLLKPVIEESSGDLSSSSCANTIPGVSSSESILQAGSKSMRPVAAHKRPQTPEQMPVENKQPPQDTWEALLATVCDEVVKRVSNSGDTSVKSDSSSMFTALRPNTPVVLPPEVASSTESDDCDCLRCTCHSTCTPAHKTTVPLMSSKLAESGHGKLPKGDASYFYTRTSEVTCECGTSCQGTQSSTLVNSVTDISSPSTAVAENAFRNHGSELNDDDRIINQNIIELCEEILQRILGRSLQSNGITGAQRVAIKDAFLEITETKNSVPLWSDCKGCCPCDDILKRIRGDEAKEIDVNIAEMNSLMDESKRPLSPTIIPKDQVLLKQSFSMARLHGLASASKVNPPSPIASDPCEETDDTQSENFVTSESFKVLDSDYITKTSNNVKDFAVQITTHVSKVDAETMTERSPFFEYDHKHLLLQSYMKDFGTNTGEHFSNEMEFPKGLFKDHVRIGKVSLRSCDDSPIVSDEKSVLVDSHKVRTKKESLFHRIPSDHERRVSIADETLEYSVASISNESSGSKPYSPAIRPKSKLQSISVDHGEDKSQPLRSTTKSPISLSLNSEMADSLEPIIELKAELYPSTHGSMIAINIDPAAAPASEPEQQKTTTSDAAVQSESISLDLQQEKNSSVMGNLYKKPSLTSSPSIEQQVQSVQQSIERFRIHDDHFSSVNPERNMLDLGDDQDDTNFPPFYIATNPKKSEHRTKFLRRCFWPQKTSSESGEVSDIASSITMPYSTPMDLVRDITPAVPTSTETVYDSTEAGLQDRRRSIRFEQPTLDIDPKKMQPPMHYVPLLSNSAIISVETESGPSDNTAHTYDSSSTRVLHTNSLEQFKQMLRTYRDSTVQIEHINNAYKK